MGADKYKAKCMLAVMGISIGMVLGFPCRFLYINQIVWPIVIIVLLTSLSLALWFFAATKDPGYIPKQVVPFAKRSSQNLNEHISNARILNVVVNSAVIRLKFCQTCMIFRPPRCSHCSLCDLCVEGFDHHCPWIGNCIGKRNYFYFFGFVFCVCLLCLLTLIICVLQIISDVESFSYNTIISIILSAFSVFFGLFIISLFGFHAFLVSIGMTTNEKIKGIWASDSLNPFDHHKIMRNVQNKYREFLTKSQYNINPLGILYQEDIDPNAIHRGVLIDKNFAALSYTFDENVYVESVKDINLSKLA